MSASTSQGAEPTHNHNHNSKHQCHQLLSLSIFIIIVYQYLLSIAYACCAEQVIALWSQPPRLSCLEGEIGDKLCCISPVLRDRLSYTSSLKYLDTWVGNNKKLNQHLACSLLPLLVAYLYALFCCGGTRQLLALLRLSQLQPRTPLLGHGYVGVACIYACAVVIQNSPVVLYEHTHTHTHTIITPSSSSSSS